MSRGDRTGPVDPVDELIDEPALAWRRDLPPRALVVAERWRTTSSARKWTASAAAALIAGPFAVLAAFVENSTTGTGAVVTVVVLAPLIEESVKGAGALWLAESRPWLVPVPAALVVISTVSGLTFAVIENWWYLVVLIDEPSAQVVRWRWTFGPVVHGVGSFVVGLGAVRVWRRSMHSGRPPSYEHAHPYIIAAAVWHGLYNGVAILLGSLGVVE